MAADILVEAVGTRGEARRVAAEEEGLGRAGDCALLAVGGREVAEGALAVAGVAHVVGGVLVEASRAVCEAGAVGRVQKGRGRARRSALLAEGGTVSAESALLAAGVADVVGHVLVEAVGTRREAGGAAAEEEGLKRARGSALLAVGRV